MDIEEKTTFQKEDKINPELPQKMNAPQSEMPHQSQAILKCRDHTLEIGSKTYIMGVLNLTPDSFYDGGKYTNIEIVLKHVEQMIEDGADIIDVGGESTRPGSLTISLDEECSRVIPVIAEIKKNFDSIISLDTTKSGVATEALKEGASIVNDISGLKFDKEIAKVVRKFEAGLILSHTTSRPQDMQEHTNYKSLIEDIIEALESSILIAKENGIDDKSIAIDPGFGFGKTAEQNLILLKNLRKFCILEKPILIGTSNKSFIGKTLNAEIDARVEGTAATVAVGILNGASIIRVHDIGYMKKVSTMVDAIVNAN